jgi:hypothetical protein
MEDGVLVIYYSTEFPKYLTQFATLERRDAALAQSFSERYRIWLAVHSLMLYQRQQDTEAAGGTTPEIDPELVEALEREERCRFATLSAVFAAREVQMPTGVDIE